MNPWFPFGVQNVTFSIGGMVCFNCKRQYVFWYSIGSQEWMNNWWLNVWPGVCVNPWMRESVNAKKIEKIFVLQIIQNGPIRVNKWLELKFETSYLWLVTQGPRLSHLLMIFEDEVDFFDFGWLDMFDIAYCDNTNSSSPFETATYLTEGHDNAKLGWSCVKKSKC